MRTVHRAPGDTLEQRLARLSPRQFEILRLAAAGNSTAQIAAILGMSRNTARTQIQALGERLGHGVARHLAVAAEREDRAPQALPVLPVETIQLVIGLHARHRIPPLTLPGGREDRTCMGDGGSPAAACTST